MTTQEQLDQVDAAIARIMDGAQETAIGSRRIRRPELSTLLSERRRLEQKLASEQGGNTTVAVFDRR